MCLQMQVPPPAPPVDVRPQVPAGGPGGPAAAPVGPGAGLWPGASVGKSLRARRILQNRLFRYRVTLPVLAGELHIVSAILSTSKRKYFQCSALFIFFVNLKLGRELTRLNLALKELTETISEGHSRQTHTHSEFSYKILNIFINLSRANPSAFKMMTYRYGVCALCTIASIFYLIGIHKIIR